MARPVMQGIGLGLIIKGLGDELAPKGSAAGNYNAMFQRQAAQGPGPALQLHPNVFGGFEGWMTQHIGQQVGGVIDSIFGIGKPSTAAPSNLPAAPRNVGVAEAGVRPVRARRAAVRQPGDQAEDHAAGPVRVHRSARPGDAPAAGQNAAAGPVRDERG